MVTATALWCVLASLTAPDAETLAQQQRLQQTVQTGTLLFSQGDCLAVKVFSGSPFTHVAIVVVEDGQPVVYDATNGPGVRNLPLGDYLHQLVPSELHVWQPYRALRPDEVETLREALRQDLGKPYRIHHHLTGQRCEGRHCSEYVTDGLMAIAWLTAKEPPRVSPGSLREGIAQSTLYQPAGVFRLREAPRPIPANETWCQWSCRESAECWNGCCRQWSRWFLCRDPGPRP